MAKTINKKRELIEDILLAKGTTYNEWLTSKENELIEESIEKGILTTVSKIRKEENLMMENK